MKNRSIYLCFSNPSGINTTADLSKWIVTFEFRTFSTVRYGDLMRWFWKCSYNEPWYAERTTSEKKIHSMVKVRAKVLKFVVLTILRLAIVFPIILVSILMIGVRFMRPPIMKWRWNLVSCFVSKMMRIEMIKSSKIEIHNDLWNGAMSLVNGVTNILLRAKTNTNECCIYEMVCDSINSLSDKRACVPTVMFAIPLMTYMYVNVRITEIDFFYMKFDIWLPSPGLR